MDEKPGMFQSNGAALAAVGIVFGLYALAAVGWMVLR